MSPSHATTRPERALAWALFHAKNPSVYTLVCKYTDELMAAGHKRYSMRAVLQRVRWHHDLDTGGRWKIPNNHTHFYALLWKMRHPDHPSFFSVREPNSPR